MGRLQAEEVASRLPQDQVLRLHLQYNHYPPVDVAFIPVAKEAIEKAGQEEWDYMIKMPAGRKFGQKLSVAQIIEGLHLESFLEEVDDENDERI